MMSAAGPWVRIVIVNYNAGIMLQECVEALAIQTMPAFETVIVDNASEISPIADLKLPDARFRILHAGGNIGFAAANNLGARGNRCRWLATLNPDTLPRPDWLTELRAATVQYPWASMFGSTQLNMNNPNIVDGFGDVLSASTGAWRSGNGRSIEELPASDCEVFSPCAAAALYERLSFERAEGFDESFFCYLEDVDLGFRLRLAGGRCVQVRRAEVLHAASAITGHLSEFSVFHSYRNRVWLFVKNLPWPVLAPVLVLQGAGIIASLARPKARPYRRFALKGLWASLHGLSGAFRQRKGIQQQRAVSTLAVARAMAWNPFKRLRKDRYIPVISLLPQGEETTANQAHHSEDRASKDYDNARS